MPWNDVAVRLRLRRVTGYSQVSQLSRDDQMMLWTFKFYLIRIWHSTAVQEGIYFFHILCHGDTKYKKNKTNFICEKNVYLGKELYTVILWKIWTEQVFFICFDIKENFNTNIFDMIPNNFKILNCKYSLNLHLNLKISIVITNYEFFNISN